jgi:endonuclease/exonuclease/phosphatase family metal-dependent hydrolase
MQDLPCAATRRESPIASNDAAPYTSTRIRVMTPQILIRCAVLVAAFSLLACGVLVAHGEQPDEGVDAREMRFLSCRGGTPSNLVRWIEPSEDGERTKLADWCATVGPAVVEDFSEDANDDLDSLAIVCWNTHVGGGDLPGLVGRLRRGALTGGQAVEHFVLLLQEVYRGGPEVPIDIPEVDLPKRIFAMPPGGDRIDIVEAAKRLGLFVFYVPSMRNGPPSLDEEEDRGNAILSTLPLSDFVAIELPLERFRRVAVAATLSGRSTSGNPWRLRLCSLHLATRTGFPRYFASAGAGRLKQAKAVVKALPETPCVLGGDFNSWAPRPLERTIPYIRRHFDQPDELDTKGTVALRLWPDKRIDYLLLRLPEGMEGRYHRLDERYGSDHYPLLGWIRFVEL